MKKILIILAIILSGFVSYCVSKYEIYTDINNNHHLYDIETSLKIERAYSNALLEGLHWYMRDDSAYWDSVFKKTIEYQNIEKANEGDWEDFYSPNWR